MPLHKVTAIVNRTVLNQVEDRLLAEGVGGLSVWPIKGFGEYQDYFSKSLLVPHVRIEIICRTEDAERIANAIVDAAHTGGAGDGFVAVHPVLRMIRIRTREDVTGDVN